MKRIILSFVFLIMLSCKAQDIVPYGEGNRKFVKNSGNYYKDTNNLFNTYEGEWKWENSINNSELTFIFKKEENIQSNSGYSYDLLVGEYKYIENGNEVANTLANIKNPRIIGPHHKMSGSTIITKYNTPECTNCTQDEKRLKILLEHNNYNGIYAWVVLRRFEENGIQKIKATIIGGPNISSNPNTPDNIDIPFGEYILIKQ